MAGGAVVDRVDTDVLVGAVGVEVAPLVDIIGLD